MAAGGVRRSGAARRSSEMPRRFSSVRSFWPSTSLNVEVEFAIGRIAAGRHEHGVNGSPADGTLRPREAVAPARSASATLSSGFAPMGHTAASGQSSGQGVDGRRNSMSSTTFYQEL